MYKDLTGLGKTGRKKIKRFYSNHIHRCVGPSLYRHLNDKIRIDKSHVLINRICSA